MVMFNVVVNMVCWYNIQVNNLVMHPTIALQKKATWIYNTFVSFQLYLLAFKHKPPLFKILSLIIKGTLVSWYPPIFDIIFIH
jgi:hypothetical protein